MKTEDKILNLVKDAIQKRKGNDEFVDFAKVSQFEIRKLKSLTGNDYSGYNHSIDAAGIIHSMKHENMKAADFILIPLIVKCCDSFQPGNIKNTVIYKKLIGYEYFYVEEIRNRRKKFTLKTFYKRLVKK